MLLLVVCSVLGSVLTGVDSFRTSSHLLIEAAKAGGTRIGYGTARKPRLF